MSNKRKVGIVALALALALAMVVVLVGYNFIKPNVQDGTKEITFSVESERDSFSKTEEIDTECGTLGEFLREFELCVWEESGYGIYVKGLYGLYEDTDTQYWWCLYVDGESSLVGADSVELIDGHEYEIVLVKRRKLILSVGL